MPHGPFICILLAQLDVAFMHYLLPLDHTCGVFNALERVITHYRDDYTWCLGPCDDLAPSLMFSWRSLALMSPHVPLDMILLLG
jgi:hypothetical protein